MKHLKSLFLITFVSLCFHVAAQEGVGIGNWRTHMPYGNVIDVELLGSKVYAATNYELFTYDKDDGSIQILNKINGLSDIGISVIRRNPTLDILMVAYANANIDLIDKQGNIYNMSDIKDKNILGNKTINNVAFKGGMAYVACGFGIVVFDLSKQEVKDTYYIGSNGSAVNVTDIAFFNGRIYAATTDGLYYAEENNNNLADFSSWSFDNSLIHPHLGYNEMEAFGGKLFLNYTDETFDADTLFVYDGNQWGYFNKSFVTNKREMRACGNRLLISGYYQVFVYDESLNEVDRIYACGGTLYPNTVVMDENVFWIGDRLRGMISARSSFNYELIQPNGPYSKSVFELSSYGKHVWIATGGHAPNWSKLYSKDGVCHFDGNWWSNLNRKTIPEFEDENISDFICCATDPMDTTVTYVGTWGSGVLKFKSNKYVIYDTMVICGWQTRVLTIFCR